MADIYVKNSLGNLTVKFNITLRYFVIKSSEGKYVWALEIGTMHKDSNGDNISAKKIHNISAKNLDVVIESALADLCSLVDWSPLVEDKESPFVDDFSPSGNNIPITSDVNVILKDLLPSAGIDISNIKVILNNSMQDFDITSEVEVVDAYYNEYKLKWITPLRVYSTYD